jgi:hypothetical protein
MLYWFFLLPTLLICNPFLIPFEDKQELCDTDVEQIQTLLREKNIQQDLKKFYPEQTSIFEKYAPFSEFESRTTRCLKQTLIDVENNKLPEKGLLKINKGGKDCFVVGSPWNRKYPELLKSLIEGLKEIGFNGYVYYRIGGVPNPSGKEAKWAGVPYAFKIFMMMEAKNLGFNEVIWLDSALFPFKNPQRLFEKVRSEGSLMLHRSLAKKALMPATRQLIEQLLQVDMDDMEQVRMWLFGLKMDQPWVESFLNDYTRMVSIGYPFMSCYPEEFVISAIAKKYERYIPALQDPLMVPSKGYNKIIKTHDKDVQNYCRAKIGGYIFVVREH